MKRLSYLLAMTIVMLCSFLSYGQVNHVVISQVYGGGGNTGAPYTNDFVELFNPTGSSISLSGWSIQYTSATGTTWTNKVNLSGNIAAGGYYLVQLATAGAVGAALPAPDATGTINMSATTGKVALVNSTTALTGGCPVVIDFVGFGTADCFETTKAPAPSNSNSISRKNGGCTDTDNNGSDFTAGTPTPRNTTSPTNTCTTCTPPTNQPTSLVFTPGVTAVSGSFTAAAAGTTAADNYLVLRSTSATLTAQPANGSAYTVGNTLGNATVVAAGNGTSFTTSSLSAGTTYYFFVYSYTTANCYNLTSPLSGATATSGAPTASVTAGANAAEPATNGSFVITLTSAAPAGGVTINYTLSGTATKNSDYTDALNGSVTIAQGATTATIILNTINDAVAEPAETIDISLDNITAPYTFSNAIASISLTDDDVAAISFTGSYNQDFNTLATSGTSSSLPMGWMLYETGTNANATYGVTDGATTSGNTYSLGTGTSTDRALGGLRSGSLVPSVGAILTNNTGSTISSLNITFTGEQWRLGTTGRADRMDFQFSTNATKISDGTWTDVDALDFIAPLSSGTAGALDGNAAANRKVITYTLSGLSIPDGSNFLIRWNDYDATSADDALGVDDLSITLGCTAPSNQPTALTLTPSLQTISGSFTAAAAGTNAADEYLVVMSPSSSLSLPPASGTVYAVDDEIGNGVVVATGNGTSFTVNNLTPGTTCYFFIYSVTAATSCYNITSPLTGSVATTTPPPCTAPTTQASALSATNITGSSMDISYTRGNGDNILVLARVGSAVNTNPASGASYAIGDQVGSGNYVVYNGPASSCSYTSLAQNTTYYFAAYEYFSADNCYNLAPLTGSFNTICATPVDVNALSATAANGQVTIRWTNPVAGCFDEVLVVASASAINGAGNSFAGTPNTTYSGGSQIVYNGTASTVTVTGLTNGNTYFFKVFGKLGTSYSNGVQVTATPYDPATGYQYLYGNLHAHSSYSDGNKDDLAKTPKDDYIFARDAQCMDFMGMSEHNHSGAGMAINNYKLGYAQADEVNMVAGGTSGNSMVTLFGMEWGVISGGGHVLVYGFDDKLIGWEASNYDVFVAKNDYASLWTAVNGKAGAIATLAHPNSTDFGGIASTFSQAADNAVYGVALASGPAFSTSKTYSDFPASLSYLNYYKTMLAKGYHLAPQMDQDNHNMTFGTANTNRMVVLATTKTREGVMDAIRNMRYYASEDCNLQVAFNQGAKPMGSSVSSSGLPVFTITATDVLPAEESTSTIELWGGAVGAGVPAAPIKTFSGTGSVSFGSTDAENVQPNNTTYYYYAIITQADGNKAVTAPIWYTRADVVLPVTFTYFNGVYNEAHKVVDLKWETAQEFNSKEFVVERAVENSTKWSVIGSVKAAGNSTQNKVYNFTDLNPVEGKSLYRLRQVDNDGKEMFSRVVTVAFGTEVSAVYTIYPNPAAAQTFVYTTSAVTEKIVIRVLDANGRTLKTVSGNISASAPFQLNLDGMPSGLHLLSVEGRNKQAIKMMISK